MWHFKQNTWDKLVNIFAISTVDTPHQYHIYLISIDEC
jgi:hypothetical protein